MTYDVLSVPWMNLNERHVIRNVFLSINRLVVAIAHQSNCGQYKNVLKGLYILRNKECNS